MGVAPTCAVSLLEGGDLGADFLDDTGALVAEDHVGVFIVGVGAAEAAAVDADEDLVGAKGVFLCGFDDCAGLGAFVDCGGDGWVGCACHFGGCVYGDAGDERV